jgi:hypothetical protein
MPSNALDLWRTDRTFRLDNVEADCLHLVSMYPADPDRVQEYIRAYAVLVSGEFQAFCRDLHDHCSDKLVASVTPMSLQTVLLSQCRYGRKLDTGNPSPSNLGADFNRFGFDFWAAVLAADPAHMARRHRLAEFNAWRNPIAHHKYDPSELGGTTTLTIPQVQGWRADCDAFALTFDAVMFAQLQTVTGVAPWTP